TGVAKTPTRSEQESYRLFFFIVANLIMGSMVWLVLQETFTRRPWKDFQLGWFPLGEARARENLDGEKDWLKSRGVKGKDEDGQETEVKLGERIPQLEQQIKAMEGKIVDTPERVEFEKLKKDQADAEVKLKDREIELAFAKAKEDELYFRYRNAKHHNDQREEKEFEKEVGEAHEKVLKKSDEYDAQSAIRDGISDKIGAIQKQLNAANKKLAEYQAGVATAHRWGRETQPNYSTRIDQFLNETKMEKFWNQEIDLVDRCQTCHMGYDKCGYTAPKEIVDAVIAGSLD